MTTVKIIPKSSAITSCPKCGQAVYTDKLNAHIQGCEATKL